jgi:hypothetical protein
MKREKKDFQIITYVNLLEVGKREGEKKKKKNAFKKTEVARHWWLTPIILATQEAEIRRIMV